MGKRKKIKKQYIAPDALYQDVVVSKFINHIMEKGKKTVAEKIVYGVFEEIKKRTKKEPLEIFNLAIRNASPVLEVKSKRVGGATYQVPMEVKGGRRTTLAMRWIIGTARSKKGAPMITKLAQEIIQAANNEGQAVRKKDNTHRMAEANRAFAHFAR